MVNLSSHGRWSGLFAHVPHCLGLGYLTLFHNLKRWGVCKLVAAIEGGVGTVDADSFHGDSPDAIALPEVVGILPVGGDRALAQGAAD